MADDFDQVKREVEELQREQSEMLGQFKHMRKTVRKEYGCKKLPEAKEMLDKLHNEMMEIAELYAKKFKRYKIELKRAKLKLKRKEE